VAARKTINVHKAGRLLGLSPQLVHWRAHSGSMRMTVHRQHPLHLRLDVLLAQHAELSKKRTGYSRRDKLANFFEEVSQ
jgi:hypothetical protein